MSYNHTPKTPQHVLRKRGYFEWNCCGVHLAKNIASPQQGVSEFTPFVIDKPPSPDPMRDGSSAVEVAN
jgi:hypothetical protein